MQNKGNVTVCVLFTHTRDFLPPASYQPETKLRLRKTRSREERKRGGESVGTNGAKRQSAEKTERRHVHVF